MNTLVVDEVPMLLQVFFAQLILADMNKELKGLRFVTLKVRRFSQFSRSQFDSLEIFCLTKHDS